MSNSYNPNKQGWGAALITCVFTGALLFGAWTIHKNTYRHPRDPMATQVYHDRDKAPVASHSATASGASESPAAQH